MESMLSLALLVLLTFLILILGMVLMVVFKIKRFIKRALTLVFTISLKPRWKSL